MGVDEMGMDEGGMDEMGLDEVGVDEMGMDEVGVDVDEVAIGWNGNGRNGCGRSGYWTKWELDEVGLDKMAIDEVGMDELARGRSGSSPNRGHTYRQLVLHETPYSTIMKESLVEAVECWIHQQYPMMKDIWLQLLERPMMTLIWLLLSIWEGW